MSLGFALAPRCCNKLPGSIFSLQSSRGGHGTLQMLEVNVHSNSDGKKLQN